MQQLIITPGFFIKGNSPPRVRGMTSLCISAQAQLQKPSGIVILLETYSTPSLITEHSDVELSAAYSSNTSPVFSFLRTVIFTSFILVHGQEKPRHVS